MVKVETPRKNDSGPNSPLLLLRRFDSIRYMPLMMVNLLPNCVGWMDGFWSCTFMKAPRLKTLC